MSPPPRGPLAAIVAAGLLIRLGLIATAGRPPGRWEYDELARNVLDGVGYVVVHLGAPYRMYYSGVLYVWLTAALYRAFPPGHTAVLVAQALFTCGLAVAGFFIARRLSGPRAGLLTAALTVTHPALAYYDTRNLHPLGFDALLTALAVLTLLRAGDTRGWLRAGLAGMVLGVAMLQRGSLTLLGPLGIAWLARSAPPAAGRSGWRRVTAYGAGAALVLVAWQAGNLARDGGAIVQSTTAEHFWVGNVPFSTGGNLLPSGQMVVRGAPEAFRAALGSRDAAGQARLFWEDARARVRAHPGRFGLGLARKFLYFWTWAPQSGARYPRSFLLVYNLYYAGVLTLAILGTIRCWGERGRRPQSWSTALTILAALASVSLVHAVFFVELRHRWGVESLLLALASVGALAIWRRPRDRPVTPFGEPPAAA